MGGGTSRPPGADPLPCSTFQSLVFDACSIWLKNLCLACAAFYSVTLGLFLRLALAIVGSASRNFLISNAAICGHFGL